MKFAFSMLKDFVDTSKSAEEIGDLLTMAGFELEAIDTVEGEAMLDIRVVSNRGDGLSVLGLAREVLAKDPAAKPTELYRRAATRFQNAEDRELTDGLVDIRTDACTRYACLVFEGEFQKSSPDWIQKRLRIAGMRPIGLLVDITNYVMLEIGQPLHAFDFDILHGNEIVVRLALPGEKLTLLNGQEHDLLPRQMMICDADRPVAAAGIMGGLETEVTSSTKRVLLESAHFESTSVRRTRKEFGLSTEASYRFERSVDPGGAVAALNRFEELLGQSSGSKVLARADAYPHPPHERHIRVRMEKVVQLLGMPVLKEEAEGYLSKLGFAVERSAGDGLLVTAPSWRPDVVQEYDVVEEIGRIHGFEKIPETPIEGTTTQGGIFGFDRFAEETRERAIRLGFVQNVSSSLMAAHPLDDPRGERIGPRNPGSPEMALLRNSLWPNLADNARRNGGTDLRLFELGSVFGAPEPEDEIRCLGMLASGGGKAENWEKREMPAPNFFSLKAAVEELLRHTTISLEWKSSNDPRLNPARQATLVQGVSVGQIHPDLADQLGLPADTFFAQIDLESVYAHRQEDKKLKPISRNPAVRRDIAILIDKAVPFVRVRDAVESAAGELLEKQWLFDVYEGKGIPEGKHSLAIALQIRKMGENLTDEEANQVRDRAVRALAKLGATQR